MSGALTNQMDVQIPTAQATQSARRNGKGANHFRRHNCAGPSFKGATEGMNGHVFQTYTEQTKRGEFQRTLEEL